MSSEEGGGSPNISAVIAEVTSLSAAEQTALMELLSQRGGSGGTEAHVPPGDGVARPWDEDSWEATTPTAECLSREDWFLASKARKKIMKKRLPPEEFKEHAKKMVQNPGVKITETPPTSDVSTVLSKDQLKKIRKESALVKASASRGGRRK